MKGQILIMGAGGRLGFAAGEAFRDAGWHVKSLVRPGRGGHAPQRTQIVEVGSREAAIESAQGCDVVLNALSPTITRWSQHALPLAYSAIAAAEGAGATLLFPGNVYNFGRHMPAVLDEDTPMHPTTRKGRIRVETEQRIREATERGMRAIVLRSGDFYGAGRGSWLDLVITKDLAGGRITYPGPDDVIHEWAYLPDLGDAMVRLAGVRDTLPPFSSFGFPGHAVTGRDLVRAIEAATGTRHNVRRMSWWFIKSLGQAMALGREIGEIEYLWRVPHRIDGERLRAAIGTVPHTPLNEAVRRSLREIGFRV